MNRDSSPALATAAVVMIAGLAVTALATGLIGLPTRFEIAHSFSGWVMVTFGKTECAPLKQDGIFLIVPIDEHGKGCTSTAALSGWRYTEYVYLDQAGRRTDLPHSSWLKDDVRRIHAESTKPPQEGSPDYERIFFVGTLEELNGAWIERPM